MVVTESRELPPPEEWRYGQLNDFEILTNASLRATQRLVRDFAVFRKGVGDARKTIEDVWPLQPQKKSRPVTLILCGAKNKFDEFIPQDRTHRSAALATLFLKKGLDTAIIVDLQASTLTIEGVEDPNFDAAVGENSNLISIDHHRLLYREYIKMLLSQTEPRFPAWAEEGLAQTFMKLKFSNTWLEFGKVEAATISAAATADEANPSATSLSADEEATNMEATDAATPGAATEDRDFPQALSRRRLMSLADLFAVKHDDPAAVNVLGNNIWAKQSYALVHWGIFGDQGRNRKAFATFLHRSTREPVTEQLVKECFNKDYKQLNLALRLHANAPVSKFEVLTYKDKALALPPPIEFREATQAEVARIKGETFLIAGHPGKARAEFVTAYARGEREPSLLASLGLYEKAHGEEDRARKFIEAAVAAKVVRPEAYVEAARWRYADAVAKAGGGPNPTLKADQVKSIVDLLKTAAHQPPVMPAPYELMAEVLARGENKASREDVQLLVYGVNLFPGRIRLVYLTTALCANVGLNKTAHSLADHGLRFAPDENLKARFAALKKALPPPEAEAPAAEKK